MAEKKSFIVRHENIEQFEMLTPEQQGALFMAMCYYSRDKKETAFDDPMLKMLFSVMRGQMSRDAEKYEDMCQKRSESGKKGGAPKGNSNASKTSKTSKTNKTSIPVPVCEPVPVPDPVPVPVPDPACVCDPDAAGAAAAAPDLPHTPHTAEELTVDWVLYYARSLGYVWTQEEAERFIAYNCDRGRRDGWDYAMTQWEKNRPRMAAHTAKPADASPETPGNMNKYLALVNRFLEDEGN
ncbi:MAG: hypothetical protein IJ906_01850 [Oscillospiraceae bacterium]|nr:hypothetical protein [Oscillospiraceae bacterium]